MHGGGKGAGWWPTAASQSRTGPDLRVLRAHQLVLTTHTHTRHAEKLSKRKKYKRRALPHQHERHFVLVYSYGSLNVPSLMLFLTFSSLQISSACGHTKCRRTSFGARYISFSPRRVSTYEVHTYLLCTWYYTESL